MFKRMLISNDYSPAYLCNFLVIILTIFKKCETILIYFISEFHFHILFFFKSQITQMYKLLLTVAQGLFLHYGT